MPFTLDDDKPQKEKSIHNKPSKVTIATGMEELYTAVGVIVAVVAPKDGEIIVANAERAGEVWERAAKRNDKVKQALEKFLTASTLAEVFAMHVSIALAIAANHSLIPENLTEVTQRDSSGNGFPMGFNPEDIPAEMVEDIFPQVKKNVE